MNSWIQFIDAATIMMIATARYYYYSVTALQENVCKASWKPDWNSRLLLVVNCKPFNISQQLYSTIAKVEL